MAEAVQLAVPLILRFVPGTAVPEPSLPGPRGEAPRPGAGGRAAPGAGPNEWERDGRAGVAGAAAGGSPWAPWSSGRRDRAGARSEKLVGISLEVAGVRVAVLGW